MREKNLYSYNELSSTAKEKAFETYLEYRRRMLIHYISSYKFDRMLHGKYVSLHLRINNKHEWLFLLGVYNDYKRIRDCETTMYSELNTMDSEWFARDGFYTLLQLV